jgi:long-chain acyl-CoA synthetase
MLHSLESIIRSGQTFDRQNPGQFEKLIAEAHGEDVALLFYTSWTTSLPKGVLLTHHNMLTMGEHLMEVDPCYPTDDFVSFLPFAWIGEQMMSISCGLLLGFTINFPEERKRPTGSSPSTSCHVGPPRHEQMTRTVHENLTPVSPNATVLQLAMNRLPGREKTFRRCP